MRCWKGLDTSTRGRGGRRLFPELDGDESGVGLDGCAVMVDVGWQIPGRSESSVIRKENSSEWKYNLLRCQVIVRLSVLLDGDVV